MRYYIVSLMLGKGAETTHAYIIVTGSAKKGLHAKKLCQWIKLTLLAIDSFSVTVEYD